MSKCRTLEFYKHVKHVDSAYVYILNAKQVHSGENNYSDYMLYCIVQSFLILYEDEENV